MMPFFPPWSCSVCSKLLVQSSHLEDTQLLDSLLERHSWLYVEITSSAVQSSNFYILLSLRVEGEIMIRKTADEFGKNGQKPKARYLEQLRIKLLAVKWRLVESGIWLCCISSLTITELGTLVVDDMNPSLLQYGHVRFPNDFVGSDVLLARQEYFEIVYTPDHLVFDSFGACLRIKLWSEYFTHSSRHWGRQTPSIPRIPSSRYHPSKKGDLLVGLMRDDVLVRDLQLHPTKYSGTPSNAVANDFFHGDDYVENSLPGTWVTWT